MIDLEILVEEPSMEAALRELLPKILEDRVDRVSWKVINMRNKGRLLPKLPERLRAYRKRIRAGERIKIIVLIDKDNDNCNELKGKLEDIARDAGLITKTNAEGDRGEDFHVVNRIVVEELESWFIGDKDALRQAFTSLRGVRFPKNFNNPDNGGTCERLHRFLKKHNIYRKTYPKISAARKIASAMDPRRNLSQSFRTFVQGINSLI